MWPFICFRPLFMMCGNFCIDLTKVKILAFIILRTVVYAYVLTKAGLNAART